MKKLFVMLCALCLLGSVDGAAAVAIHRERMTVTMIKVMEREQYDNACPLCGTASRRVTRPEKEIYGVMFYCKKCGWLWIAIDEEKNRK